MSCQFGPTILTPALGWVAADSDIYPGVDCWRWLPGPPAWAGIPRGLFKFQTHTSPILLTCANRAAVEAELGRSLPASDPATGRLDGHVQYWYEFPQLFRVRNLSGVNVTVVSDELRCTSVAIDVLNGQELEIGPWWGRGNGGLRVQVIGPTPGPGGVDTVPSGVDVKVTAPARSDPGLTPYVDACASPAVVVI